VGGRPGRESDGEGAVGTCRISDAIYRSPSTGECPSPSAEVAISPDREGHCESIINECGRRRGDRPALNWREREREGYFAFSTWTSQRTGPTPHNRKECAKSVHLRSCVYY
jgi:hypothetical protein